MGHVPTFEILVHLTWNNPNVIFLMVKNKTYLFVNCYKRLLRKQIIQFFNDINPDSCFL